ncbi:MAG TPA: sigma-70 family RNA polymerase sigma factor [Burkholderiaceae bacterium]|nr:sigma-70 family RNA polymerase sigma factor [Burkholderiaceae bacterium]
MYRPVVYIVDDDPAIRRSLALWLGFRSVATRAFESAESFLAQVDANCQGCAIVDVRMSGMDGLQLQQQLATRDIHLPLLFLTGHGDVPTARAALMGGAFDFLEKPVDNDRLVELVTAALAKDEQRWETTQQSQRLHERMSRLTAREREVMRHVVAGRHNREIAAEMGISARTVEVYKARLMDKLDVRRIADLIRIALQNQATEASSSSAGPSAPDDS